MDASCIYLIVAFLAVVQVSVAPPVTNNNKVDGEENSVGGLEDYMEYHRYLKEVVNALESDPEFRKKLEKADEQDIKSGRIADELEFVSHHVRSRLDEIKRVELERLKELVMKKRKMENESKDDTHGHLDHSNVHTFEIEDLKKLIAKTTEDLAEADKKRKEEFKEYEIQKEIDRQLTLNETANEEERLRLEKEFQEREEKHKRHASLHEPGHKAQLEQVWEEQDQMQQQFDPKTFFMLHDLDSNGLWDQDEVKALFIKELDKMYAQGAPEDDMRERVEEMERMRESVFKEMDYNRDGFIDFNEFMIQTKRAEFQQDHGWQSLDQQRQFTQEELEAYIKTHQANQIPRNHGYHQGGSHGGYNQMHHQQGHPQQQYQQPHPGYQQPPQAYHQPPPGGYQQPIQPPPGGYQQLNQPGGYQQQPNHPQANYQYPNQPPQGNFQHPNQPPPGNYPQHQPPPVAHQQPPQGANYQQQQHPNQPPQVNNQQQHPNQPPQVNYQQQHPNQPPQVNNQQQHPNQPPQVNNQQNQPPQAANQVHASQVANQPQVANQQNAPEVHSQDQPKVPDAQVNMV